jgi:hypothetical protein
MVKTLKFIEELDEEDTEEIDAVDPNCFMKRDSLLQANACLISQLQSRLKAKRFRPQEGDNAKLGYVRALIQALQAQNILLKDTEMDEINTRLKKLEGKTNEKPDKI